MLSKYGVEDEAYERVDNTSSGKYGIYANQCYVVVVENIPCCTIIRYSTCVYYVYERSILLAIHEVYRQEKGQKKDISSLPIPVFPLNSVST